MVALILLTKEGQPCPSFFALKNGGVNVKKHLKRLFCVFLVSLLLSQEVLADVAEPATVASASDAEADAWIQQMLDMLEVEPPEETIVDFDNLPAYDPLAGLSEEQYAAYCQTFIDHPSVLLEYPEGVPQPRFALALSSAAVYVLYLLAAAVGIVFTWNFTSWVQGYDGYEFFSGFEMYMRAMHSGVEDFWNGWDAVMNATWGKAISGMKTVYKYLKEYCVARMEGYGTEMPSYNVTSSIGNPVTSDYTYAYSYFGVRNLTEPVYFYVSPSTTFDSGGRSVVFFVSAALFEVTFSSVSYHPNGYYYYAGTSLLSSEKLALLNNDEHVTFFDSGKSVSFFHSLMASNESYYKGVTVSITPDASIVDVQEKTFTAPADTITLPADQTAADTLGSKVSAATDAATVTDALTGTWDLGETQAGEDTDDAVYPWVPDITGWLERLKQGIDAIHDGIASIPDTLANILDGIQAIPGQITDFFTVDTVAVSAAFAGLQDTFALKFPLLGQLQSIFSYKGQSFDQTPPVFTMQVPECLKFAYPNTDTIVVLDLTPYADYFGAVRTLLTATLWLMFAQWVLNEFNIKFHVG